MPDPAPLRRSFLSLCLLVSLIALLPRINGFRIMDDAYMFARYTDHLLEYGDLRWNPDGLPTFGATSVLYVVALVPFRLLFPDNATLALWASSFVWGLIFSGLAFRLLRRQAREATDWKPDLVGFGALSIAATMAGLFTHFTSGMGTTFVMSWLTGYLLLLDRWARDPRSSHWIALVLLGGCAYWVRPDMLVFALGMPGVLVLAGDRERRIRSLPVIAFTVLATLGLVLLSRWWIGSWLPNSFYAKSMGLYGESFRAIYRPLAMQECLRFLLRNWPPLLLGLMWGLAQGRKWWRGIRPVEVGALFCGAVFMVYYTFGVLQVMGFGQRFYYPALPVVLYLGGRWLARMPEGRLRGLLKGRVLKAGLVGVVLGYGLWYGSRLRGTDWVRNFGKFGVEISYRQTGRDYWVALEEISALPDDLVIATTEVGLPAALNPGKRIVDLAGLNSPEFIRKGVGVETLLHLVRPDVIYLPHPDYADLAADFHSHPLIAAGYRIYSAEVVKCAFGIGILHQSPYFRELEAILDAHLSFPP